MVQATLITASAAAIVAGIIAYLRADKGCTPKKRGFRVVSALIWFSLAFMWIVALTGDYYMIRSGIMARALIILQAAIYIGELLTESEK